MDQNECVKNMKPLVSIIIPVYNAQNSLRKCIDSVLKQTYRNIQVVAVNDGSSDNSLEILQRIAISDSRLVIVDQINGGVSAARNAGIANAQGEYIVFVDSDDWVEPNLIASLLYSMTDEVDFSVCGFVQYEKEKKITKMPVDVPYKNDSFEDSFRYLVDNAMLNTPWGKLYKVNMIHHSFDIEKSVGEDLDFNMHYLKDCRKIAWVNEVGYHYDRRNENSLSQQLDYSVETLVCTCEEIENLITERHIYYPNFSNKYYGKFRTCLSMALEQNYSYKDFTKLFLDLINKGRYSEIAKTKNAAGITNRITRISITFKMPSLILIVLKVKQLVRR